MRTGLKNLKYREGSRIQYFEWEIAKGSVVVPARPGGLSKAVPSNGCLVFINEWPLYDWSHDAQLVFITSSDPSKTLVLFRDWPGYIVNDSIGREIKGKWETLGEWGPF